LGRAFLGVTIQLSATVREDVFHHVEVANDSCCLQYINIEATAIVVEKFEQFKVVVFGCSGSEICAQVEVQRQEVVNDGDIASAYKVDRAKSLIEHEVLWEGM
jgi:hypothetical protein